MTVGPHGPMSPRSDRGAGWRAAADSWAVRQVRPTNRRIGALTWRVARYLLERAARHGRLERSGRLARQLESTLFDFLNDPSDVDHDLDACVYAMRLLVNRGPTSTDVVLLELGRRATRLRGDSRPWATHEVYLARRAGLGRRVARALVQATPIHPEAWVALIARKAFRRDPEIWACLCSEEHRSEGRHTGAAVLETAIARSPAASARYSLWLDLARVDPDAAERVRHVHGIGVTTATIVALMTSPQAAAREYGMRLAPSIERD
jgi:hypothetical protein